MSKKRDAVRQAHEKGYRVIDGNVFYNGRIRKLFAHKKKLNNNFFYYSFGIRVNGGSRIEIYVHQLAAYQKFGEESFGENIIVEHKDGNTLNNNEDNISIRLR
jgi:hypothetical protein